MRAIILAAGKGERLRSVEPSVPKPMVRIGSKPVLALTIQHLASHGIRDIIITTGYLYPQIVDYFGSGDRFGVTINYTIEATPLGTAGGLRNAFKYPIGEPILVWHGDNLSTCNPQRMLEYHSAHGGDGTIAACWRKNPSASGHMAWDDFNQIEQFEEKRNGGPAYGWVSAGVYILEPSILNILPATGDLGQHVFPAAVKARFRLYAYGFSYDEWLRWYDTPEDLATLRKDYP